MNFQLIVFQDKSVVVSNEIPYGMYIDDCYQIRTVVVDDDDYWKNRKQYKKIIAGVPGMNSIDYSQLSIKERIKIGKIDYTEIQYKNKVRQTFGTPQEKLAFDSGFREGLAHIKLMHNSEFDLDDMIDAYDKGCNEKFKRTGEAVLRAEFIESLKHPKIYDIQIKTILVKCKEYGCGNSECIFECNKMKYVPDTNNNSIKITKIL